MTNKWQLVPKGREVRHLGIVGFAANLGAW